jgi:hypothetical protein
MLLARLVILALILHATLRDGIPSAWALYYPAGTADSEAPEDDAPPTDSEQPSQPDDEDDSPEVELTFPDALFAADPVVPCVVPTISSCGLEPSPTRSTSQIYSLKRLRI